MLLVQTHAPAHSSRRDARGLQTRGGSSVVGQLHRLGSPEEGETFLLVTPAARATAWHRLRRGPGVQGWAGEHQGVRSIEWTEQWRELGSSLGLTKLGRPGRPRMKNAIVRVPKS